MKILSVHNSYQTPGGEEVFARVVHHPGSRIPERSYLRSSLAEMAGQIETEMKAAALEAIQAQMGS